MAVLEHLERAVRSAGAGLWYLDGPTGLVELTASMRRLLGPGPVPRTMSLADIEARLGPDEWARARGAALEAMGSGGSLAIDLRIRRFDDSVGWLQVTADLRPVPEHDGAPRGGGLAVDITARKRSEQRLSLAEGVSRTIASADTLEQAAPEVLAATARGTETAIVSLWLPSANERTLGAAFVHAEDWAATRFAQVLHQTSGAAYAPGEGMPGTVWVERKPVRLDAVADEPSPARTRNAIADGLTVGMAFPLMAGSVFVGVIEVLGVADTAFEHDARLVETLSHIGRELGQFILRSRAEARLRARDTRQGLLVSILEAQRNADDAKSVIEVAAERLGRELDVARVGFFEAIGERVETLFDWTAPGAGPPAGSFPAVIDDQALRHQTRAGRVVSIDDLAADPRSTGDASRTLGAGSLVSVPIMRSGQRVAGMVVYSPEPRDWARSDRHLCREVADHTWDAVERIRALEARRESDSLARTISDNSSQGLVLIDADGAMRYANAAAAEMLGFDGSDVGADAFHDLVHHHLPDGRPYPRHGCPIDRALTRRETLHEHADLFFRKDGHALPIVCSVSPVTNVGRPGSSVIEIRDVTASTAAARQLADTERRLRATFENAAVGVAHVGLDGRWLRVNRKLCRLLGYGERELLERTFQDVTHPDDLEADLEHVQKLLRGDAESYSLEKRYLRRDGRPLWAELTVSLGRDDAGQPEYFISVISDIEARKSAEARMQTALAVKDEFLGLVSHELRTPMTVVMGMSRILASGKADGEQVQAMAQEIAESAAELHELIESMLILARVDKDEAAIREPALLGRVAADSIERRRRHDSSRTYELAAADPALVDATPSLLDRVISNLVSNAAKYSQPGEPVRVVVEADEEQALVRVLDHGAGLDDETLGRVFEPFYRAERGSHAPGAGLGLSVVSRIVDSLGGRVWARRTDVGNEFGFALPLLRTEDS